MAKQTWRRTLIAMAAELRDAASQADVAAQQQQAAGPIDRQRAEALRERATCYREAAKLLDDPEDLIGAAHGARD